MIELNVDYDGKRFKFLHLGELDHIFSVMRKTGTFYEEELLSALLSFLKRDDWVADVGANIGNHAIYFVGICGCNVIAFEPNPKTADLPRQNIALNNLQDRIQVHQVVLCADEGAGEIVAPRQRNLGMASVHVAEGSSGYSRIDPLPKYLGEQTVGRLNIDTEGMDYSVLMGAEPIIDAVNHIRTETSSRLGQLPKALAQHVADLPGASLQSRADHETRDCVRKEIGGLSERLDLLAV